MKKLLIVVSAVCLFASCKKDQLSISEPGDTNSLTSRVRGTSIPEEPSSIIGEDCNYIKLTQTAPNVWEAYFGLGSLVRFSDLHIRNDGRLYGKIISAGTNNVTAGYPILSGYDIRRDFSFEQTTCSATEVTKEEVTLTYQQYLASTNGQTTFSTVNGSPYNASQILTAASGGLNAYISGLINNNIVFKRLGYSWTSVSCTGSYLTLGKLVAKNVVQLPDGSFTCSEFGIAPLCYKDGMIIFYAD